MKVVLNEIKKIFSLKMVSVLMVISIIMYFLFISFYIEYFPNGRQELDYYNIGVEMINNYEEKMDEKEFVHFKDTYSKQVEEADRYLQSKKDFVDEGITSYEKFKNMDQDIEKLNNLHNYVFFEVRSDIFWQLQVREQLIEDYKHKDEWMGSTYETINEKQEKRIQEIANSGNYESVFPYLIFENYNALIKYVAMLVVISIIFMISPIFLKDKLNKVNLLQHTSKNGRNLFKKKVASGLIASFVITTIQLLCFFIAYSFNNVEMFFNSNINSVFGSYLFWYDLTFMQYIVITVIAVYILSFVIGLIVMFISSIANNYITLIGVQVPIIFIISQLLPRIIGRITDIYLPKYFIPITYFSLIIIGIVLITIRWKKEKILDIVN
ncbi:MULTISPECIES: hypothetical protein [unclassified Clostridium]|uniref:hypothetical protein n=1 Tax=unclassified Clostridium TaxID=2614128 RepID=UPI0025C5A631|nr:MULTISPECIES: hypothetical protein [unclassified Clostridium]